MSNVPALHEKKRIAWSIFDRQRQVCISKKIDVWCLEYYATKYLLEHVNESSQVCPIV